MIRDENEYRQGVERLAAERERMAEQERVLRDMGMGDEEVKRVLDPVRSFHAQLAEEVAAYERLRRGEFGEIHNLSGLGHLLVSLRIAKRLSQRELAERLGVDPSQVCRDERNEYRGVTLERATRVLEALGASLVTSVEPGMSSPAA